MEPEDRRRATLAELLACVRQGRCAGGGCLIGFDQAPLLGRLSVEVWNLMSRTTKWAAGSFVFCRADIFREIGGFPAGLFAAEEIRFSRELKRLAKTRRLRLAILQKQRHLSSGRKFYLYSRGEMLLLMLRGLFTPWILRDPKKLKVFYDGRR
jgi:GT2 family glycosyltransferase